MHYQITYRDAHQRTIMFLDAADAATAVHMAKECAANQGSAFELVSIVPRPDVTPNVPVMPARSA